MPTLPIRPTTKRTTTPKTQKRVTVRRTTRKPPTKKPDDVRRPIDKGVDVKKGSLPSWISIPIVFAVLAALIAFFIVRRRRAQSSIESPKEKSEDENQNIERRKSLSDIESGDPSTSKSELNESRAKFQELKDKFNKPADEQERPGPPKPPTKTPGKVNASLLSNIESVGVFKPRTEYGRKSFLPPGAEQEKAKPESPTSEEEINYYCCLEEEDNKVGAEITPKKTTSTIEQTKKEHENFTKGQNGTKSTLGKAKDLKASGVSNDVIEQNSRPTNKKDEGSNQKSSPTNKKESSKQKSSPPTNKSESEKQVQSKPEISQANESKSVKTTRASENLNATEKKNGNSLKDTKTDESHPIKKPLNQSARGRKEEKKEEDDPQLLQGLTKTRTRGRAGRKPPSRAGRKNALKDGASSRQM